MGTCVCASRSAAATGLVASEGILMYDSNTASEGPPLLTPISVYFPCLSPCPGWITAPPLSLQWQNPAEMMHIPWLARIGALGMLSSQGGFGLGNC